MKLLVIPDVHGINTWKRQVNEALLEKDTHIVFLGDYVDNYVLDGLTILNNLKEIIELKKMFPTRITLLLGNHDYAYIFGKFGISGFDVAMWWDYRQIFNDNWKLFQLAWGFQGKDRYTLLTHAGLTESFYATLLEDIYAPDSIMHDILIKETTNWWLMPIHELLNYFIDQVHTMWQIGYMRKGASKSGSILWADKHELINDRYTGIDQIVGHTINDYVEVKFMAKDKLYFTDVHTDTCLTGFMIELE